MKRHIRLTALLITLVLVFLAAGCDEVTDPIQTSVNTPKVTLAATAGTPTDEPGSDSPWPSADEKAELSYWVPLYNAAVAITDYNENLVYQTMEEMTNVHIQFIHPATGEEKTSFNLMVSSATYADIIEFGWSNYNGGAQKAIDDGVIVPLNDLLTQFAPDAYSLMTKTDSIYRQCTTDSGIFYAFMAVGCSESITNGVMNDTVQSGPIVRADWLTDLNIPDPVTLDDWTGMLTAFRDQKGAQAPLTVAGINRGFNVVWSGAYGVGADYYIQDGKVLYGPAQESYKQFLLYLNTLYNENLLDPDFASNDNAAVTANMLNGISGAMVGAANSGVGNLNTSGKEANAAFDVKAITYPVLNAGDEPQIGSYTFQVRTGGSAALSGTCRDPELAARYLNFFYTEEGGLLKNFGKLDYSYTMDEAGNVYYTDLLKANPDGLTTKQALSIYSRGDNPSPGPVIKTTDYTERELEAWTVWSQYADNFLKTVYPSHATQSSEEAEELATLVTNITSYSDEMFIKFVMGTADLETEWDEYITRLESLNIARVLALKQAAVDRYNAR